ncbi:MAG: thiamine pyrophosphate-dependent enzyme [Elusimicrobiota bacterium]
MTPLNIEELVEKDCATKNYKLEDYEAPYPARWCKGCGDFGVLTAIQKVLRDANMAPENVVCCSGIGCSSRLPHYLKTYGFHGIHGRALTLSTGVSLARPDLKVITIMGDGDCFSIGGNHWLHAIRYNVDLTVLVLDNEVYALTKKQASPTTPQGGITNTTPRGSYLKPLNPISTMMGIANVSFLAQTATWFPTHLEATIQKAWKHKGLSFVRVLQRCPAYMPAAFGNGGLQYPAAFLKNDNGIPFDADDAAAAKVQEHDQHDLNMALRVAAVTDPAPMGLIYWNPDLPTYNETRLSRVRKHDRKTLLARLDGELDKYAVKRK